MKKFFKQLLAQAFEQSKISAQISSTLNDFRERDMASSQKLLSALERSDKQVSDILDQINQLTRRVEELQRSAPGRGNVALPDGRLLTRMSMPEFFKNDEPIYFVNAEDKLIVPKLAMSGYYELGSTRFVARNVRANSFAVDVGANFGYYTILMARLVGWKGKVLAFEPEDRMYRLLLENSVINWVDSWVKLMKVACTESTGQATFVTSKARAGNTGPFAPEIASEHGEDFVFTPFAVKTVTLDSSTEYLSGIVDFMKIDVEGGEPAVIAGAGQTIAANPQIKIMMEWSPGQLRRAGHDISKFASELAATGLGCHRIFEDGTTGVFEYEDLAKCEDYQNIVLMRS